ncbi:MAG: penicillin acylase family protein [FCB group bacterium]|jgi:acyl-homoserine lactone acylase PvdQ|nr:penicillin acylase family protein [FCB group bacterium]
MKRTNWSRPVLPLLALTVAICGIAFNAEAAKKDNHKLTLYRDIWGIPHIYANSEADAAYGLGYAQAEDRLEDVLTNVRASVGTLSEAFGDKFIEDDRMVRMMKNDTLFKEYWEKGVPPNLKALGDSFIEGVKAYMKEHPEKVPAWAPELHGWQSAAIMRRLILDWPVGTFMDDYNNRKEEPPRGSNEWAVMPERSADGVPILMTDPHLTWEGMAVFHEARLHGGDLHMSGFFVPGCPFLGLGHNNFIGWACTTGGPDTSDVYVVKLNPDNPMQYQYDGKWLDFETRKTTIPVKDKDPVEVTFLSTVHGPIIGEPDTKNGVAYAAATPYLDEPGLFEQQYKMCMAKNTDEFYQALGMNLFMEQNLLFADRDGNVQYVRTGRVPARPDGYDWDKPVDGSTSASRWLGIEPIENLVQIKNPEQGYLQNCNISPAVMTENSPMLPEKYKKYIYNTSWDKQNNRGRRALQLLAADDSITKEEAIAYTTDTGDFLAEPWKKALKEAVDKAGAEKMKDAEFAKAANDILAWDGMFDVDSVAAPVVMYWRLATQKEVDTQAIFDGKPLAEADQVKLLEGLSKALAEMKGIYGKYGVTWGDINVVGRDGRYFPAGGMRFGEGAAETGSLRVVKSREMPDQKGKFLGRAGSSTLMLMFFPKDRVESYSVVVWGNSADPKSPHYLDQAEKLYSTRQMKPTFWDKKELLENVEAEKTLTAPGA